MALISLMKNCPPFMAASDFLAALLDVMFGELELVII